MTQSRRRDVLKAAGTVTIIGGLAGCSGQENVGTGSGQEGNEAEDSEDGQGQEDGMGAIRVAHASPDAPNVDVYVDDEPAIEDLGFREVSPYEELEPGAYQIQITATDDPETVVFDEEIEVEDGVTNTAVAYGEAAGGPENGFTVEILEDDLTEPGEEMSRVRLFHASPDAEEVDIVVTQPPDGEAGDEQSEDEAPEEEPPAGEQPEDEQPEQTQQEEQPPEEGQPEDEGSEEGQPEEGQPEDEGQPDDEAPQQDEPLFEGVAFGETDSQEVPAGEYTLGVVPAGGDEQQPEDEGSEEGQPEGESPEEGQPEGEGSEEGQPEGESPEEGQPEDEPEQTQQEDEQSGQEPVAEFDLTAESQTVYTAFAVGYVNPEEAETEDEEEFEVITVEDAQAGERSEGGSEGEMGGDLPDGEQEQLVR